MNLGKLGRLICGTSRAHPGEDAGPAETETQRPPEAANDRTQRRIHRPGFGGAVANRVRELWQCSLSSQSRRNAGPGSTDAPVDSGQAVPLTAFGAGSGDAASPTIRVENREVPGSGLQGAVPHQIGSRPETTDVRAAVESAETHPVFARNTRGALSIVIPSHPVGMPLTAGYSAASRRRLAMLPSAQSARTSGTRVSSPGAAEFVRTLQQLSEDDLRIIGAAHARRSAGPSGPGSPASAGYGVSAPGRSRLASPTSALPVLHEHVDAVAAAAFGSAASAGPAASPMANIGGPMTATPTGSSSRRSARATPLFSENLPDVHAEQIALQPPVASGSFSMVYKIKGTVDGDSQRTLFAVKEFKPEYTEDAGHESEICMDVLDALGGYHDCIVRYYCEICTIKYVKDIPGTPEVEGQEGSMRKQTVHELTAIPESQDGEAPLVLPEGVRKAIVYEWIKGPTIHKLYGSLETLPVSTRLRFVQRVGRDMLLALSDLARCGIAQNDVKDDNLLFCEMTGRVKLIDFSNAASIGKERLPGNTLFCPPERLAVPGIALGTGKITELSTSGQEFMRVHPTSDSYSAGQVLFKGVEGEHYIPPYPVPSGGLQKGVQEAMRRVMLAWAQKNAPTEIFSRGNEDEALKIMHGREYQARKEAGYYDFINMAMNPNPRERWTPAQLLQHAFIENGPDDNEFNQIMERCKLALVDETIDDEKIRTCNYFCVRGRFS